MDADSYFRKSSAISRRSDIANPLGVPHNSGHRTDSEKWSEALRVAEIVEIGGPNDATV